MTEIGRHDSLFTFINVFTCEPQGQAALVRTLVEETESTVSALPGFVSAKLHASVDGTRVCNYAQWTSLDAFKEMMASETGRAIVARVRRLATDVDIHVYRVERTLGAGVEAAGPSPPGRRARDLVEQVWSAVEEGDIERLEDLFGDDAELTLATGTGRGLDYVKGVFRRHRQSYPDLRREMLSCVESPAGDAVAIAWRFSGTQLGELRTPMGAVPPSGRSLTWSSSDHVRVENGRIVSWSAHFDRLSLMEQLGLMPAPAREAAGKSAEPSPQ